MNRPLRRFGFTLVEAMVATTITALAGAVLLLAVETSLQTTADATDSAIAEGIARQLVDEIMGHPYMDPDSDTPYQMPLTASLWEWFGQGRERFDDTDDYNGYSSRPVVSLLGVELGQEDGAGDLRHANFRLPADYFEQWSEQIEVYYVDDDDPSVRLTGSDTSNTRAVEVRIWRTLPDGAQRLLAHVRRVYAYVAFPL